MGKPSKAGSTCFINIYLQGTGKPSKAGSTFFPVIIYII